VPGTGGGAGRFSRYPAIFAPMMTKRGRESICTSEIRGGIRLFLGEFLDLFFDRNDPAFDALASMDKRLSKIAAVLQSFTVFLLFGKHVGSCL
jgi:hypothetical protein